MSRLRFVPIVVVALALHSAVLAAQQAPVVRTLASFRESGSELTTSPDGRFVLQATPTKLRMYDVASRQSWDIAEGSAFRLNWSPRGDMVVFARAGDGEAGAYVWAMPVDANTGRARGPAQRVTVGRVNPNTGAYIQISGDGRWIAFAGVDSGQAMSLSIVPVTGGPERVVARFPRGLSLFDWSADGRTIFVNAAAPGGDFGSILRVRVADGATEVIRSRREFLAGMTADRRHLVLVPIKNPMTAGDQGTVIDTAGRDVGHFPLPVGPLIWDRVLGDSSLVCWTETDSRMIEVRPVAGGNARRLPLIGESDDLPLWSPDGNRIAFQVREGNRTSLAVTNADGTNPRVFRETDVLPGSPGARWSPDSRSMAFMSPDRHRLSLLDVVAGTHRTILEDTASVVGMVWRWRTDGRAIIFVSAEAGPPRVGRGIDEVAVSGQRRKLIDMTFFTSTTFRLVGDSNVFVRSDSAVFLVPLGPGPMRRLASLPPGTPRLHFTSTVVSNDLRWIAGFLLEPRRPAFNHIELFSTETGARTVLELPFEVNPSPQGQRLEFLPGDNSLLVFGQRSGETDITLYRVPLNGDMPRALADVGSPRMSGDALAASASPDGRWVVYGVQPEPSTGSFVLVDLRGAVPRATSRSPRR
jgi:Tol biopolymer transport system component